MVYSILPRQA